MMRFWWRFWYAHLRSIDLKILWPACKEETGDLDHAKAVFAAHAFQDLAWLYLGEEEIRRQIDGLK
jgi:hypothetical protein